MVSRLGEGPSDTVSEDSWTLTKFRPFVVISCDSLDVPSPTKCFYSLNEVDSSG